MYLQITTKCNMHCAHCCYSCGKNGKHGDIYVLHQGIEFASSYGEECIAIGGGEPTLHPRFFDILRYCLTQFPYVWMATNGSRTARMRRLHDILLEQDFDNEDDCISPDLLESELTVALSQDPWHDPIDRWVVDEWRRQVNRNKYNFEVRDVSRSVIAVGRAKRTGAGWVEDDCVCSDIIIKPNGDLRLCGCPNAPVIGTVFSGVEKKWDSVIYDDDGFSDSRCTRGISKNLKKRLGIS